MSETLQPLTVRDFIAKYVADEAIFEFIPEFSFIKPVSAKVKAQNCFCGLAEDLSRATMIYNDFVAELDESTIMKLKTVFGYEKICFSIQSQQGFSVRCY